jgi:hypothetical protein
MLSTRNHFSLTFIVAVAITLLLSAAPAQATWNCNYYCTSQAPIVEGPHVAKVPGSEDTWSVTYEVINSGPDCRKTKYVYAALSKEIDPFSITAKINEAEKQFEVLPPPASGGCVVGDPNNFIVQIKADATPPYTVEILINSRTPVILSDAEVPASFGVKNDSFRPRYFCYCNDEICYPFDLKVPTIQVYLEVATYTQSQLSGGGDCLYSWLRASMVLAGPSSGILARQVSNWSMALSQCLAQYSSYPSAYA